jgi:hypothetical protein
MQGNVVSVTDLPVPTGLTGDGMVIRACAQTVPNHAKVRGGLRQVIWATKRMLKAQSEHGRTSS